MKKQPRKPTLAAVCRKVYRAIKSTAKPKSAVMVIVWDGNKFHAKGD